MQFAIAVLYEKLSNKCPFYEIRISDSHTFTVSRFILLSFKHQTNKTVSVTVTLLP